MRLVRLRANKCIVLILLISISTLLVPSFIPTGQATTNSVTWTTKGDFENNASTVDGATERSFVNISGQSASDDASIQLEGPKEFKTIAAGAYHSLALLSTGEVLAWGLNNYGQLGQEQYNNTGSALPIYVKGPGGSRISNAVSVFAGGNGSAALLDDGKVVLWGDSWSNQNPAHYATNPGGSTITDGISVDFGGNKGVIFRQNGSMVVWGDYYWPLGDGWTGTTGAGYTGPRYVDTTNIVNPTSVVLGGHHFLCRTAAGEVLGWGYNHESELAVATDLTWYLTHNMGQVTPAFTLNSDGSGHLSGVEKVAAGDGGHSLALLSTGEVMGWGSNAYNEVGLGDDNPYPGTNYVLMPDYIRNGDNSANLSGVSSISASAGSSAALMDNGEVQTWGYNLYGTLGNGNNTNSALPVNVKNTTGDGDLTGVDYITAGVYHFLALLDNGQLLSWGYNNNGQLGDNSAINSNIPLVVKNPAGTGDLSDVKARISYQPTGIVKKLKYDAGSEVNWTNISWNGSEPAGTDIKFRTRGASTEEGLESASWSNYVTTSGNNIGSPDSRWLEVEITLKGNINTPVLNDLTIRHQNLSTLSVNQYNSDNRPINVNGHTNSRVIKIKIRIEGFSNSSTLVPQLEIKKISANFDGTNLISLSAIPFSGNPVDAIFSLTGLSSGTYHYRVRFRDNKWRISAWTYFNNGNSAFTVDRINPAFSSVSISNGARLRGRIRVRASATDNIGLSKMEIYRDDLAHKIGIDSSSPYCITWDTSRSTKGRHKLIYKIFDRAGNSTIRSTTVYLIR